MHQTLFITRGFSSVAGWWCWFPKHNRDICQTFWLNTIPFQWDVGPKHQTLECAWHGNQVECLLCEEMILWPLDRFIPRGFGMGWTAGDRFRGTRRSSDPASHICHPLAPAPPLLLLHLLLKSKSQAEFHQDLSLDLKTRPGLLEMQSNIWGWPFKWFPKPEEFLSGLVC